MSAKPRPASPIRRARARAARTPSTPPRRPAAAHGPRPAAVEDVDLGWTGAGPVLAPPPALPPPPTARRGAAPPERVALLGFLEALDEVHEDNEGITDTEVREVLAGFVLRRLVTGDGSAAVPATFQMMRDGEDSAADDARLRHAVVRFVSALEATEAWRAATTPAERRALIARDDVQTRAGNAYWLYLGPWD